MSLVVGNIATYEFGGRSPLQCYCNVGVWRPAPLLHGGTHHITTAEAGYYSCYKIRGWLLLISAHKSV